MKLLKFQLVTQLLDSPNGKPVHVMLCAPEIEVITRFVPSQSVCRKFVVPPEYVARCRPLA